MDYGQSVFCNHAAPDLATDLFFSWIQFLSYSLDGEPSAVCVLFFPFLSDDIVFSV